MVEEGEQRIRYLDLFGGIGGFRQGLEEANQAYREHLSLGRGGGDGGLEGRDIPDGQAGRSGPAGPGTDEAARREDGTDGRSPDFDRSERRQKRFDCVWYCDIERNAVAVYNRRFGERNAPSDITKASADDVPAHELICGGFPCQAFSSAGRRKGFEDTRGTLFFEICRIAERHRPRVLFLENVKGLLNHDSGRTFGTILMALDDLGYDVEWEVLNSKNFGVPQNRERVFIVGHLRGQPRFQIFPLGEVDEGAPRRPEKEGGDGRGREAIALVPGGWSQNKTQCHKAADHVHTIATNASESNDMASFILEGPALMKDAYRSRTTLSDPKEADAACLRSSGFGRSANMVVDKEKPAYSWVVDCGPNYERAFMEEEVPCVKTGQPPVVMRPDESLRIRRLTPIECERLQGFPDNWTAEGTDHTGKTYKMPETKRYQQCGNAVTVNVIRAIGIKLLEGWP